MAKGSLDDIARLKRLQVERREARASIIAKPERLAEAKKAVEAVSNVVNGRAKTQSERPAKWRSENPDLNRKRARDGMKKTRANGSS